MVSDEKNKFRFLLRISAILCIAFLISGDLLLRQLDAVLGFNNVDEQPPEEEIIGVLPESNGYTLRRNPTEYQIELFELLVNTHDQFYETGSDEDLKDYASAIVQNFVADFFTLSNKNSRPDVGGLQFFSEEVMDNFKSLAIDEFYLYLNQHLEIFGSESLPTVASTTILSAEFDVIFIETEDEDNGDGDDNEEHTSVGYLGYGEEEEILGEEVRSIIIDIEWTYVNSTLPYIDEFQTEARFLLIEVEDEGVRIFQIGIIEEKCEQYDYFGNCLDDCNEIDYWGNCLDYCEELDAWGSCIIPGG